MQSKLITQILCLHYIFFIKLLFYIYSLHSLYLDQARFSLVIDFRFSLFCTCLFSTFTIKSFFLPGCGGVIHSDTGTIKSPNFPQNFPANVECSWKIIAHEGNHLEMSYNSNFQIPDSTGTCLNSYIKVSELSYYGNYTFFELYEKILNVFIIDHKIRYRQIFYCYAWTLVTIIICWHAQSFYFRDTQVLLALLKLLFLRLFFSS